MWISGGSLLLTLILKLMSFSYYEVYITSLRALTALGMPYGLDEDAAYMVTWLELNKLEGVKKLAEISTDINKNLNKKINLKDIKSKSVINLKKNLLLINGPSLFDYLYEETIKYKKLEIYFENCVDPIFIIPLAKTLSKNLKFIRICWVNQNKKKFLVNITKNNILIGESKKNININNGQVLLQFSSYKKNTWKKNLEINNINYKINFNIEQKHLKDSLKPEKKYWDIILKLSKKTLVSATKQSRSKGAGGGNDND